MKIISIGIDPGKSCGLAVLLDGRLIHVQQGSASSCMDALEACLTQYAYRSDVDIEIGIERYTITPQTGRRTQQTSALEITGMVDMLAERYGVEVVRQTISDVKRFAADPLLRKLGLWVKPSDVNASDADDAKDAVRHAVYRFAMRHAAAFTLRLKGI